MRPIALWATPRTASTAFDKMVRARGDLDVLTEPFSVPYYDGPEQRSTRFPVTEPDATLEESGYEARLAAFELVTESQGAPPPVLDTDDLRREPDGAVERWCAAVGLDHRPDAHRL